MWTTKCTAWITSKDFAGDAIERPTGQAVALRLRNSYPYSVRWCGFGVAADGSKLNLACNCNAFLVSSSGGLQLTGHGPAHMLHIKLTCAQRASPRAAETPC
jgi:hypothetical protein